MYMSEISKFKISDLKPQKMTILWTLKYVSAISKHPVFSAILYYFLLSPKSSDKELKQCREHENWSHVSLSRGTWLNHVSSRN